MKTPDSNALARLRLALIPGLGPITQRKLVLRFGSACAALAAGDSLPGFGGAALATALSIGADEALVERTLSWLDGPERHLIAFEDEAYPELLREIDDPPGVIYAIGHIDRLKAPCVAVVGARNATPQGVRDAYAMSHALSQSGLCITSGLALGIDAAAHRGGLDGPSSSIAVMGTGPDVFYPKGNFQLAQRVASEGCVVTEFPLGTPAAAGNFPRRNRLISGLARAVLVVEANERSGSLVTARCALQQGRDVLAMPGSIHSPLSKGCHKLIREGATLVECAADVLAQLGLATDLAPAAAAERASTRDSLLQAIGDAPATPDQLVQRTGLAAADVAARLCLLHLEGWIEEVPGGRFQRVAGPARCA
jgi:DNA processing protein